MAAATVSATSSTETKYPVLINGYLCYSAAEVRAARQAINPRTIDKATGLPKRESDAATSASASGTASSSRTNTLRQSFMDTLRSYTAQGTSSDDDTRRQRGSLLDILA